MPKMAVVVMDTDSQLAQEVWDPHPRKASVCMCQLQRSFFFPKKHVLKLGFDYPPVLFIYLSIYLLARWWVDVKGRSLTCAP